MIDEHYYCVFNIAAAAGVHNRSLVSTHIQQQGSVDVLSLKSFFIGPSCVGKTTARRRLTREIDHLAPDEIVPSTGIDAPLTVQLYHETDRSSVLLSGSERGWKNLGLEEQGVALCSHVFNTLLPPPSSSRGTSPYCHHPPPVAVIPDHLYNLLQQPHMFLLMVRPIHCPSW